MRLEPLIVALALLPLAAEPACAEDAHQERIRALMKQLTAEDMKTRWTAGKSLALYGNLVVPHLVPLLRDRDELPAVVFLLVSDLGPLAAPAVPHMIRWIQRGEIGAIGAVSRVGRRGAPAVPALLKVAQDAHLEPFPRALAIRALGRIGTSRTVTRSVLHRLLRDGGRVVRESALEALALVGPPPAALHDILAHSKHPSYRMRLRAVRALSRFGPDRVELFLPRLEEVLSKDPDERVRAQAARSMGDLREAAAEAIPSLERALRDEDAKVRRWAVHSLSRIAAEGVAALSRALAHEDLWVKRDAADALGRMGPLARRAVPALIKNVRGLSWWARLRAIEALGSIGPHAKPAVPTLVLFLQGKLGLPEPDRAMTWNKPQAFVLRTRRAALMALARIGPQASEALPAVRAVWEQDDPRTRVVAALAFTRLGGGLDRVLPSLRTALTNQDPAVRAEAARAVGRIGPPAREVGGLLRSRLGGVLLGPERVWLSWALGRIEDQPTVITAAEFRGLGEVGRIELLHSLAERSWSDPRLAYGLSILHRPSFEMELAVIRALGSGGASAAIAIPRLSVQSESDNPTLAIPAERALARIRKAVAKTRRSY